MILCSDATFEQEHGTGDPTEIALLIFGDDLGIDRKMLHAANHRTDEHSFDSDRKLMSTLNEEAGKLTVFTNGAIENLLFAAHFFALGGFWLGMHPPERRITHLRYMLDISYADITTAFFFVGCPYIIA